MPEPVSATTIGAYGPWAAKLLGAEAGSLSYRRSEFDDIDAWRKIARGRLTACLAAPDLPHHPTAEVVDRWTFDGLDVEHLRWQLGYGPDTEAYFLKPAGESGPLPGVLALHDHGGNKYFGKRKIVRVREESHPLMTEHQASYYGGAAWANEIARRGYGVLVPDAFPFASRRVRVEEVVDRIRDGLTDDDPEHPDRIASYNAWAAGHESVMAKSLFCAGTTWPGVFLAEDQQALDVLCARDDVDETRVGCGGLSGGGMRTVFLGGADERIRCAVCVGMMSTWRDFLLHKSYTHTWMVYVPLLPRDLDYPEILGLRVPLPTLVQNDEEDQLFTLEEMKRADQILFEVYDKAGATDRYRCTYYPGPHKFDRSMQAEAFDWFDRWLAA